MCIRDSTTVYGSRAAFTEFGPTAASVVGKNTRMLYNVPVQSLTFLLCYSFCCFSGLYFALNGIACLLYTSTLSVKSHASKILLGTIYHQIGKIIGNLQKNQFIFWRKFPTNSVFAVIEKFKFLAYHLNYVVW